MAKGKIEDILQAQAKVLYKYFLKLGVPHSDAEDIVQDTLYKTLVSIETMIVTNVKAWMFKVGLNVYHDYVRKKKRIDTVPIEVCQLIGSKAIEEELLQAELQEEIRAVFETMHVTYKHVLLLKYDYDLSYREIAQVLDMSEDVVRTTLYRARNVFKERYEVMKNGRG
ncbi:RNA polymerase sigma factor [Priestia taiwanensis]|uniref:DNA-directed RNA polymerase sigma-70 factor n=1 Tax=Priestia taiwanensis TaxID=1347902 RepID=A0A917ESY0_9BACI|nr:sigma-70 family RNA polymerase sigma factor [Priestia taiwanensis]MBM7363525.1 RNA polymerase sigma-70 factor (ECF subfamily) [Priestia taiwanensis]GGE76399.1 DNA-directed RNA polymerase sigma-70 factor [Priestia taiwanensis]